MDLLGIQGEQAESEAITPDPRARHSSKVPQGFGGDAVRGSSGTWTSPP